MLKAETYTKLGEVTEEHQHAVDIQEDTDEVFIDDTNETTDFRENLIDILEHIANGVEDLITLANATTGLPATADATHANTLNFGGTEDIEDITDETQIQKTDV